VRYSNQRPIGGLFWRAVGAEIRLSGKLVLGGAIDDHRRLSVMLDRGYREEDPHKPSNRGLQRHRPTCHINWDFPVK
jgi:hypothetical protein